MKLSLQVGVGNSAGKVIPITVPQFVIGRDPQCQLRPASPIISKRHCALVLREGRVYVKDYESTNGTLVNEERVVGERELRNEDRLKIGPLEFTVRIESPTPVDRPTPPPKAKGSDDEDIADMLLSMQDEEGGAVPAVSQEVPEGSTVFDMPAVPMPEEAAAQANGNGNGHADGKKPEKAKAEANTASAAEAILAKYSRRNRR